MSRLERLWVLLDQGSTPTVRKAAAEQIGEVLSAQPGDLENILRTLCKYLRSKNWHTRIAAGQAVEAIGKNVKTWNPDFDRDYVAKQKYFDSRMTFEELDVEGLLSHGKHLLASSGHEYAMFGVGGTKLSVEEQAAFYRKQLNERLGITSAGKIFSTGMEKLIEDSDLVPECQAQLAPQSSGGMSSTVVHSGQGESSRSAGSLVRDTLGEPPAKKPRDADLSVEESGMSDDLVVVEENMWPFAGFCYQMLQDLDHPQWEYRHGAATAVRGVVKFHGRTAGITAGTRLADREESNVAWLEDAAVQLITVLALDRFADFIGDEVVAPVRATCSQALGLVLGLLPLARVKMAAKLLMHMAVRKEWEVRYSSLLAIQHLLAARASDAVGVLPLLIPAIVARLEDPEDDVKGTAAAALLPVAQCMAEIVPAETVSVVQLLWNALVHLDDLSAATGSIMELLARLLAVSQQGTDDELVSLLPRLFPFMSHGIASVRDSCLKAFLTLLKGSADTGVAKAVLPRQQVYHCSKEQTASGVRRQSLQAHLTTVLCLLFHRVAFESHEPIRNLLFNVWTVVVQSSTPADLVNAVGAWFAHWLDVASYPAGMAADNCVLVQQLLSSSLLCKGKDDLLKEKAVLGMYILGGVEGGTPVMNKDVASITARIDCMRCLGFLFATVCQPGGDGGVVQPLVILAGQLCGQMVASKIAMQRIVVGLFLSFWATFGTVVGEVLQTMQQQLELALLQPPFYEEVIPLLASMQRDCQSLVMLLSNKGVTLGSGVSTGSYTVDFASQVATSVCNNFLSLGKCSRSEAEEIKVKQQNVITGIGQLTEESRRIGNRVSACLAGALVAMQCQLDKLNPVIRPLMEVVKRERNSSMQEIAGFWLTKLLSVCSERKPSPNSKLVRNLCLLAGCSPYGVPSYQETYTTVEPTAASRGAENPSTAVECTWRVGILSLAKVSRKLPGSNGGSHTWSLGGRGGAAQGDGLAGVDEDMEIQFNGVQKALENFARHFGSKLFEILPDLWLEVSSVFKQLEAFSQSTDTYPDSLQADMQHCLSRLQVLRTLCSCVHPELREQLLSLLPALGQLLGSQFTLVRHMAANCLAAMIQVHLGKTLNFLAESVLPSAGSSDVRYRQGVIETLFVLVDSFSSVTVDFAVLFVMPVMGRMSDQDTSVRLAASMCFAQLIPLAALQTKCEQSVPQFFLEKLKKSQDFVEQLLDPRRIESYKVPVWIKAELRSYQKDGVNWLAFLSRFNLHGILCDDMGLGKTLQSICMLAGDHTQRKNGPEVSLGSPLEGVLPSLVVCPPTLTGHWCYEVDKFCPSEHLRVLHYAGNIGERMMLQSSLPGHDLVVASYDVVRNDLAFFRSISWNYCILDEGHIIKNPKAKITKAVKELKSNHRLILTGTPIQNNVVDLWSLFDFLMPGYLGNQRQFQERFSKPILSSRDAKSSSKEQEAGALAMEALHKQVLPFMLRRMKDDVLDDLPPKIIQDYYCDLSPLQVKLYESHSKAMMKDQSQLQMEGSEASTKAGLSHVFQALQYLKKVCNHPKLVLDVHNKLEQHAAVWEEFRGKEESLSDIDHAAKFLSLKQLLIDCGFRSGGGSEEDGTSCSAVSQHRALVFCQLKSMLDILENDLLRKHLPEVTYLRLDGSTPAHQRHSLVQRFNTDPSIDLLLLTTHVGGLGLSLTGADTVIFIEHDWNPTKDLQAMDRCHRIGQKRVVNVYRLITRGTLEEKIMNLQKFKLNLANTVVSQENASFAAMDTSSLLDLFSLQTSSSSAVAKAQQRGAGIKMPTGGSGSLTAVLQELSDIWDERDYSTEYDLQTFTDSLPSNS